MGSNWSWPCGNREKPRYKVTTGKAKGHKKKLIQIARVQAESMPISRLILIFKNEFKAPMPSYIINHPTSQDNSIMISQIPTDIFTFNSPNGTYQFSRFPLSGANPSDWCISLQDRLASPIYTNQSLISCCVEESGLIHLLHSRHNVDEQLLPIYIVKHIGQNLSSETLKKAINEERGNLFKACFIFQEELILIMELSQTPQDLTYYVVEYPPQELEQPGFEAGLSGKIEMCISKQELKFAGMVAGYNTLYLIFAQ